MPSPNGIDIAINPFLDTVYRVAVHQAERPMPVGVVSKSYRLIDHQQLLRIIAAALVDNGIDTHSVNVKGEWTVNGERAHFSILFPATDDFTISLGDPEDRLQFRIEIFNSVDGSWRLMAVAGWLRFVCSNGLILGTSLFDFRQQHRQELQLNELDRLLRKAIESVASEKETIKGWLRTDLHSASVERWVDEQVSSTWNIKAAVRVFHIIRDGCDVALSGNLRVRPSQIETRPLGSVPGVYGPAENVFGVSQALSWIAGQRSDISEDLRWRAQVPELVEKLLSAPARQRNG